MKELRATISSLGAVVRMLRRKSALSQETLAKRSGSCQFVISNIETGVTKFPTLDVLRRIAGVFRMEVAVLFVPKKSKSKEKKA